MLFFVVDIIVVIRWCDTENKRWVVHLSARVRVQIQKEIFLFHHPLEQNRRSERRTAMLYVVYAGSIFDLLPTGVVRSNRARNLRLENRRIIKNDTKSLWSSMLSRKLCNHVTFTFSLVNIHFSWAITPHERETIIIRLVFGAFRLCEEAYTSGWKQTQAHCLFAQHNTSIHDS